ncbi:MAG: DUF368 domain-containing protein [Ruminiclostridium sp.]|nr:DUF368 domain-containing protein [Ruminiclostridium sp.]
MQNILAVLYGLVFGIANVIPGVSGGTMLVVFGCYDKVCGALTLNLKEIKKNIVFLIFFGIGTVLGIVGFAFVVTWLFENFPTQTNMFFMGLIIGSVPLIIRNATVKDKFKPVCFVPFIIGLAAVVGLALAESGSLENDTNMCVAGFRTENGITTVEMHNNTDRTVKSWEIEFEDEVNVVLDGKVTGARAEYNASTIEKIQSILGFQMEPQVANCFRSNPDMVIEPNGSYVFTYEGELAAIGTKLSVSYKMDVPFFLTMMVALFVAAIAMIIPGVSGSFVMLTLGVYTTVIGAVKDLDFAIIIPCAIGAVIGLVFGARLITWLMKKYSLMTYSAILGLVAGSIYVILPAGFGLNLATLAGVVCLAIGAFIAYIVGKNTKVGE